MPCRCMKCGREWSIQDAHEQEMRCTRKCNGVLVQTFCVLIDSPKLETLPTFIALPLAEYLREAHPVLKLHRLCDAAELITRWFTIIALAELRRDDGEWPKELLRHLQQQIERPTFGQWRNMLSTLLGALPNTGLVASGWISWAKTSFLPALNVTLTHNVNNIIDLRNRLAHGGAIRIAWAEEMLLVYSSWIDKLIDTLITLPTIDVLAVAEQFETPLHGLQVPTCPIHNVVRVVLRCGGAGTHTLAAVQRRTGDSGVTGAFAGFPGRQPIAVFPM